MEIKIRVGAQTDQSLRYAFRPLVQSAVEARRLIMKELGQVPRDVAGLFAAGGRGQTQVFRGVVSEARAAAREQQRLAKQTADEEVKQAKLAGREQANESRRALADMRRDHAAYERDQRAASRRMAQEAARNARELDRFASRTSYGAMRFLTPHMPIASFARRAAGGIVHGLGIDPSFSGALERNIKLESVSGAISNQSRLGGTEISARAIQTRIQQVSSKYGLDREQTAEALRHFVDRGGDVTTGMAALDKLAERSIVTSTNINDLAQLGADASMHMGNVPNKMERLFGVIDAFGVQSDRGAMATRQVARQSPKLLAVANKFGGNVDENQVLMGALAQLARMGGGAANPAQAATSVVSFANTLEKDQRLKHFDAAGVKVYNGDNTLRNAVDIIKDAIHATNNDPRALGKLFSDTRAKSVINPFITAYREGGGGGPGGKGDAAIDAMVDHLTKGTKITDDDAKKALAEFGSRTSTQVEKFQQAFDNVVQEVQVELLPTLKECAPEILKLVKAFGELATLALQNPWTAVVAALGASLLRAGIESVIRAGIERAIKSAAERLGGIGGFGGPALGAATVVAVVTTGVAYDQVKKLDKAMGPTGARAWHRDLTQLLPGVDKKGKFDSDKLIESFFAYSPIGMLTNPKAAISRLRGIGGTMLNLKDDLSFSRTDENMNLAAQSAAKAEAVKRATEMGKDPSLFTQPEEKNNFQRVTGRPGESLDQLRARVLQENQQKKDENDRKVIEQKNSQHLEKIASAVSGANLNVNVTNFPDSPSDDPTAPAPDG